MVSLQFLKHAQNDKASPFLIGDYFVDLSTHVRILTNPVNLLILHQKAVQKIVGKCVVKRREIRLIVS